MQAPRRYHINAIEETEGSLGPRMPKPRLLLVGPRGMSALLFLLSALCCLLSALCSATLDICPANFYMPPRRLPTPFTQTGAGKSTLAAALKTQVRTRRTVSLAAELPGLMRTVVVDILEADKKGEAAEIAQRIVEAAARETAKVATLILITLLNHTEPTIWGGEEA
jgi:hypothetical protein